MEQKYESDLSKREKLEQQLEIIRRARENTVLSVVVVDAVQTEETTAEKLEEKLLGVLGAEGKYDCVEIDLSVQSIQTEEYIAKLRIALSSVGEADLVICNEEIYKEYAAHGAFSDVAALLGDETKERMNELTDGQIDLSKYPDSFLSKCVDYEPAYLCVMEHSERKDAAAAVLEDVIK